MLLDELDGPRLGGTRHRHRPRVPEESVEAVEPLVVTVGGKSRW